MTDQPETAPAVETPVATPKATEAAPAKPVVDAASKPVAPAAVAKPAPVKAKAKAKTVKPRQTAPKVAKPATPAKPVAKKAPVKAAAKPVSKPATPKKRAAAPMNKTQKTTQKKDTRIMTTAEKMTAETKKAAEAMTDRAKALFGDVTSRAKTAFEKGSELVSQAGEFNKGNVEALVESGKIAAKGAQQMGQAYAEDARHNFEEMTAAFKQFAAVKSPTEFMQLQGEMVRKSFDTMVAQGSKHSEAWLKLAGDIAQPISNRISVAIDTIKKAA